MAQALRFSVPESDFPVLASLCSPGSWTTRSLADADALDPETRVLSVMIYDHVTPERLAAFPRLEAVVTRSDGTDHLPLDWLRDHGIAAYHLKGYATQSVAHLAIMMTVACLRRVPEAMVATRQGVWDRSDLVGRHLGQVTVGILGTGRIGQATAGLLVAMGAEVLAYDITPDPGAAERIGYRYVPTLDDLLRRSDLLSVHVPLDDSTRGLLDAAALDRLPPGAVVVNTARGGVLDTEALIARLETGRLGGFAADVLPGEPLVPHLARLKDHPNVLLTPHLGAHNQATIRARYAIEDRIIRAVLEDRAEDVADYRVV